MEPKNLNNQPKKSGEIYTNISTQTKPQNTTTGSYDTITFVHNRFSSLVSSEAVYSLQYTPKKKQIIK